MTAPAGAERVAREVVAQTLADVEAALPSDSRGRTPRRPTPSRAALESDVRPVVLADLADNVGGGGPGDGTALLAALVEARARGAVVTVVDAAAVRARARPAPMRASSSHSAVTPTICTARRSRCARASCGSATATTPPAAVT